VTDGGDGGRPGEFEDAALEGRQTSRIEMLDDLEGTRRVEAGEATIAMREDSMVEIEPILDLLREALGVKASAAISRARHETSVPTTRSNPRYRISAWSSPT